MDTSLRVFQKSCVILLLIMIIPSTSIIAAPDRSNAIRLSVSPCSNQNSIYLPLVINSGISGNSIQSYVLQDAPPTEDEKEPVSPGIISIAEVSETTFNPTNSTVEFQVSCKITSNPSEAVILINDEVIQEDAVELSDNAISLPQSLKEGRNHIVLLVNDSEGNQLVSEATLWAGSNTLNVKVIDENNQPVSNATVTVNLADDQNVNATILTDPNGLAKLENIPARTVFLTAKDNNNRFASLATTGDTGDITLSLQGFDTLSTIDNNDFSLGTSGWNIGTAPVQIIQHVEGLVPNFQTSATDMDLMLNTSGEGQQSISRTFKPKSNVKNVTVRYRFITSEVPGGYFGTEFNDYFNISIRSQLAGTSILESNSMNGLGLGAFDSSGATEWRETPLSVDKDDTIQVDIAVANVADGLYDSQVVVDLVQEKKLSITSLALNDIDNRKLKYLSTAPHSYFGGNTRVHGTITVEGDKDDELQSLVLEIIQGGNVVATANLATDAKTQLLEPFGEDEKVEITTSQLLFELPSAQAANINGATNGTLSLRVKAKSSSGEEATKDFGAVEILVRYTNSNRYGLRDGNQGGDDWIKPSVKTIIEHFSNITVGDMSNMNGGKFSPHSTHQDGRHVDGWFNGYNARDAATAATIISHLNDATYGSKILTVYVTYQQTNTNAFWNAIKNVTLNDGRMAKDVIKPINGHTTHFHWIIAP